MALDRAEMEDYRYARQLSRNRLGAEDEARRKANKAKDEADMASYLQWSENFELLSSVARYLAGQENLFGGDTCVE
jgi:hypothetical protein